MFFAPWYWYEHFGRTPYKRAAIKFGIKYITEEHGKEGAHKTLEGVTHRLLLSMLGFPFVWKEKQDESHSWSVIAVIFWKRMEFRLTNDASKKKSPWLWLQRSELKLSVYDMCLIFMTLHLNTQVTSCTRSQRRSWIGFHSSLKWSNTLRVSYTILSFTLKMLWLSVITQLHWICKYYRIPYLLKPNYVIFFLHEKWFIKTKVIHLFWRKEGILSNHFCILTSV